MYSVLLNITVVFLISVIVTDRYFTQLVKNETELLLSPFTTHGEKLMKTLLQCLEKVCINKDRK
jgi:hypothetical protein